MSDTPTEAVAAATLDRVRAVIAELGEATAAAIGQRAGLAYSTTTPKLRALEDLGHARRFRATDNRTLWRLTDDGHLALTTPPAPADHAADTPAAAHTDTPAAAPADDGSTLIPVPVDRHPPAGATDPPPDPASLTDPDTADPDQDGDGPDAPAAAASEPSAAALPAAGTSRRAKGTLNGAVMDVLESAPGRAFKVSELCRLIDAANADTDVKRASAGAVVLAAHRLVRAGRAVIATEKPLSFQLCPSR